MATKIFSADVTFSQEGTTRVLKDIPLLKIPIHIILSKSNFWWHIKKDYTEIKWQKMIDKKALPKVSIKFNKQVGIINQEEEFPYE